MMNRIIVNHHIVKIFENVSIHPNLRVKYFGTGKQNRKFLGNLL